MPKTFFHGVKAQFILMPERSQYELVLSQWNYQIILIHSVLPLLILESSFLYNEHCGLGDYLINGIIWMVSPLHALLVNDGLMQWCRASENEGTFLVAVLTVLFCRKI